MVGFLVHNIDSLLLAVADSCSMLDDVDKHSVIQTFAYKLEERYAISRDQLRMPKVYVSSSMAKPPWKAAFTGLEGSSIL